MVCVILADPPEQLPVESKAKSRPIQVIFVSRFRLDDAFKLLLRPLLPLNRHVRAHRKAFLDGNTGAAGQVARDLGEAQSFAMEFQKQVILFRGPCLLGAVFVIMRRVQELDAIFNGAKKAAGHVLRDLAITEFVLT